MLATTVPEASTSAHLALAEGLSSPKSWIVTRLHESWTASQAELIHATHPALLATNRAMVRLAILELNYRTETIFALIESPSDKHQRHARRYSTNVSRTHTAIRQKSAAYTPLFNKCQRHTHRYLTNVSGIYTAIRQNSAAYSPLFDKCQRYTPRYSTRSTCTAIYTYNACLRTHFRDTYPQQICGLALAAVVFVALYSICC